eukprot:CAMPEP_0115011126 /NCGR_PEP_ID=MMETSP0216-20121206/23787_1 /TAXON_ID=223996 /ORGANISM="Protocruzia adherens, Strain Boccale" /LENGTH=572 /DNA_ID=CAMNT_0002379595 /DNA_START=13 /DNA_END=1731 /DNA_ORIENTATION=+
MAITWLLIAAPIIQLMMDIFLFEKIIVVWAIGLVELSATWAFSMHLLRAEYRHHGKTSKFLRVWWFLMLVFMIALMVVESIRGADLTPNGGILLAQTVLCGILNIYGMVFANDHPVRSLEVYHCLTKDADVETRVDSMSNSRRTNSLLDSGYPEPSVDRQKDMLHEVIPESNNEGETIEEDSEMLHSMKIQRWEESDFSVDYHILFVIQIRRGKNGRSFEEIKRRYSEFLALYKKLQKEYPCELFPLFPSKVSAENARDDSILSQRMEMLNDLLKFVKDKQFQSSAITKFLDSSRQGNFFGQESRETSRLKGVVGSLASQGFKDNHWDNEELGSLTPSATGGISVMIPNKRHRKHQETESQAGDMSLDYRETPTSSMTTPYQKHGFLLQNDFLGDHSLSTSPQTLGMTNNAASPDFDYLDGSRDAGHFKRTLSQEISGPGYTVQIPSYQNRSDSRGEAVYYDIRVVNLRSRQEITLSRRFKEFKRLNDALSKNFEKRKLPSLPSRTLGFSKLNETFLEQRRQALMHYLKVLLQDDAILMSLEFRDFLSLDSLKVNEVHHESAGVKGKVYRDE